MDKLQLMDNDIKYGLASQLFHWVRALLLVIVYIFAFYKPLFHYHKFVGMIIFMVLCMNIVWRYLNNAPKSLAYSSFEEKIEKTVYVAIYCLVIMAPVLGYLGSIKSIHLGIFILPSIYSKNIYGDISLLHYIQGTLLVTGDQFAYIMRMIHKLVVTTLLLFLIFTHILAIFINMLIRGNKIINRMVR